MNQCLIYVLSHEIRRLVLKVIKSDEGKFISSVMQGRANKLSVNPKKKTREEYLETTERKGICIGSADVVCHGQMKRRLSISFNANT